MIVGQRRSGPERPWSSGAGSWTRRSCASAEKRRTAKPHGIVVDAGVVFHAVLEHSFRRPGDVPPRSWRVLGGPSFDQLNLGSSLGSLAASSAMTEVERRLACEGMFKHGVKHNAGNLRRCHALGGAPLSAEAHDLRVQLPAAQKTMDALARAAAGNDHEALIRVLRERVVAAAGRGRGRQLDLKTGPATYTGANGQPVPVRNLVEDADQVRRRAVGLTSPEAALAFFKTSTARPISHHLRAAVPFAGPARVLRTQHGSVHRDRSRAKSGTTCLGTPPACATPAAQALPSFHVLR